MPRCSGHWCWFLSLLLLLLRGSACRSEEWDRLALTDLATSTGLDNWVRSTGWLDANTSVCDWDLVGCDASGRVKLLTLSFNNLSGVVPSSIGNLTHLQDLDMEYNQLSGQLPDSFDNLKAMVQLGLGGNSFTGPLPTSICSVVSSVTNQGSLDTPACDLSGSAFTCPLPCPELASKCGAVCIEGGKESRHVSLLLEKELG